MGMGGAGLNQLMRGGMRQPMNRNPLQRGNPAMQPQRQLSPMGIQDPSGGYGPSSLPMGQSSGGGGVGYNGPPMGANLQSGLMSGGGDQFNAPTPTLSPPPSMGGAQMPPTGGNDVFNPLQRGPVNMGPRTFGQQPLNLMKPGGPGNGPGTNFNGPQFGPGPASHIPPGGVFPQLDTSSLSGRTTGTWIDDYLTPQGDGFTGTRNGQNFINGRLYAAQGNASGGNEFNNLLAQQWYPRIQGLLGR